MSKELEEAYKYDLAMHWKDILRRADARIKLRNKLLSYDSVLPDNRITCSLQNPIPVKICPNNMPYKKTGLMNFIRSILV
jgi:hypothetical protein